MKPKKKKCKGNYRSNHFEGCGKETYLFKYGLCKACFSKWLYSTSEGETYLKRQLIPKARKEVNTKRKKQVKKQREELKTHKDWLKDLQKVFNKYIRLRDQGKNCISCNRVLKGKYDAGHFFSVGAYPNLRFNEDNVHAQCVHCNQHKHGNIAEYSIRLPQKIGLERFEELQQSRSSTLKLSIPEIKTKIEVYKQKIKVLQIEKG